MKASARKGSATVEFALVVPLFFLITFGLVNFAVILAGFCGASYATQVAIRYAVVRGGDNYFVTPCTNTDIKNVVAPYLWAAQKNSYTVTTTWTPSNNTGSVVTVAITLTYKTGIPFSALNTINLGTSSSGTIVY